MCTFTFVLHVCQNFYFQASETFDFTELHNYIVNMFHSLVLLDILNVFYWTFLTHHFSTVINNLMQR